MTWKYFTDSEVYGLVPEFVAKLDKARKVYGSPIVITSGFRTPDQNNLVGGVSESSHVRGLGVDISCLGKSAQNRLIWALGVAGIHRVGVYPRHIHADDDRTKPFPALWQGNY